MTRAFTADEMARLRLGEGLDSPHVLDKTESVGWRTLVFRHEGLNWALGFKAGEDDDELRQCIEYGGAMTASTVRPVAYTVTVWVPE